VMAKQIPAQRQGEDAGRALAVVPREVVNAI